MGAYDSIQIPVSGQPISVAQYGTRVRDAILDLDARVARIESTMSNYTFKSTNTTRASTATLANDPDLVMFLEANSRYFIEFFITCAATATADIQTNWSVPGGTPSFNRRVLGPGTGSTANAAGDNLTVKLGTHGIPGTVAYNGARDSNSLQFQIQEVGVITTGSNSGNIVFQWAQNTSNATGTVVFAESFGRATKLI